MAVVSGDPLDIALDQVASILTERMSSASGVGERVAAALDVAALWDVIARHALDRGDAKLLALASQEYRHFIDIAVLSGTPP